MRKRRSRISRQNTSQRHFGALRGAVLFEVALKYYGELFSDGCYFARDRRVEIWYNMA